MENNKELKRLAAMVIDLQDRCYANQGEQHWLCKKCKYRDLCNYTKGSHVLEAEK